MNTTTQYVGIQTSSNPSIDDDTSCPPLVSTMPKVNYCVPGLRLEKSMSKRVSLPLWRMDSRAPQKRKIWRRGWGPTCSSGILKTWKTRANDQ